MVTAWVKEAVQKPFQDILSDFDFAETLTVKLEGYLKRSFQCICNYNCVLSHVAENFVALKDCTVVCLLGLLPTSWLSTVLFSQSMNLSQNFTTSKRGAS